MISSLWKKFSENKTVPELRMLLYLAENHFRTVWFVAWLVLVRILVLTLTKDMSTLICGPFYSTSTRSLKGDPEYSQNKKSCISFTFSWFGFVGFSIYSPTRSKRVLRISAYELKLCWWMYPTWSELCIVFTFPSTNFRVDLCIVLHAQGLVSKSFRVAQCIILYAYGSVAEFVCNHINYQMIRSLYVQRSCAKF